MVKKSTAASNREAADKEISLLRNRLETSEEKIAFLEQEVCQLKSVISQVQTSLQDFTERGGTVGAAAPTAAAIPTVCGDHLNGSAPRNEIEAPRITPLEHRAPPSEAVEHQPLTVVRNRSPGPDVREKYEPLIVAESGTFNPVGPNRFGSSRVGLAKRKNDPADRNHESGSDVRVGTVTDHTAVKCRFYSTGQCRYGQSCKFQHSANSKTERRKRQRKMAKLATDKTSSGTETAPTASDP